MLRQLGLLRLILPEVTNLIGVPQDPKWHPEGDAYTHTLHVMEILSYTEEDPLLLFAALLHDIGKATTTKFEDGRWRSKGHAKVGAELAVPACERLGLSVIEKERVVWLVASHMRLNEITKMKKAKARRLIHHPFFRDLLRLRTADVFGSSGDMRPVLDSHRLVTELREPPPPEEPEVPALITGQDVLGMGVPEGPEVGRILTAVRDAQLDEDVTVREEALKLARSLL